VVLAASAAAISAALERGAGEHYLAFGGSM
jgi:hypothetical protein